MIELGVGLVLVMLPGLAWLAFAHPKGYERVSSTILIVVVIAWAASTLAGMAVIELISDPEHAVELLSIESAAADSPEFATTSSVVEILEQIHSACRWVIITTLLSAGLIVYLRLLPNLAADLPSRKADDQT